MGFLVKITGESLFLRGSPPCRGEATLFSDKLGLGLFYKD